MMLTMNNVTHEAGNKKYGEAQHNTQYLHTIYTLHIHMYTSHNIYTLSTHYIYTCTLSVHNEYRIYKYK